MVLNSCFRPAAPGQTGKMRAGKTFFSQVMEWIHPGQFRRCVRRYQGHDRVRRFAPVGTFQPLRVWHGRQLPHRVRLQPVDAQTRLGASDKKDARQHKTIQPRKIDVAAIHLIERIRFKNQLVQDFHLGLFSLGNRNHRRNRPAQIQQRVPLDGCFGGTKARPRKQAQAQVNRGRVLSVNRLRQLHAKGFVGIQPAGAGDQPLRQVVLAARALADFHVRQAISVSQLREGYGQKLIPTRKAVFLGLRSRWTCCHLLLSSWARFASGIFCGDFRLELGVFRIGLHQ